MRRPDRALAAVSALVLALVAAGCTRTAAPPVPKGAIGALVHHEDGHVVVREVPPGLGAANAGVRVGDEIVAIDGHEIAGVGPREVLQMLRGEPGTRVHLRLRRGEATIEIDVLREEVK